MNEYLPLQTMANDSLALANDVDDIAASLDSESFDNVKESMKTYLLSARG